MFSSILFGKDPRLGPIRILDTATEETPNPNPNANPNPNPNTNPNTNPNPNLNPNPNDNDLINIMSHDHIDLMNIMSSSILFGKDL